MLLYSCNPASIEMQFIHFQKHWMNPDYPPASHSPPSGTTIGIKQKDGLQEDAIQDHKWAGGGWERKERRNYMRWIFNWNGIVHICVQHSVNSLHMRTYKLHTGRPRLRFEPITRAEIWTQNHFSPLHVILRGWEKISQFVPNSSFDVEQDNAVRGVLRNSICLFASGWNWINSASAGCSQVAHSTFPQVLQDAIKEKEENILNTAGKSETRVLPTPCHKSRQAFAAWRLPRLKVANFWSLVFN